MQSSIIVALLFTLRIRRRPLDDGIVALATFSSQSNCVVVAGEEYDDGDDDDDDYDYDDDDYDDDGDDDD